MDSLLDRSKTYICTWFDSLADRVIDWYEDPDKIYRIRYTALHQGEVTAWVIQSESQDKFLSRLSAWKHYREIRWHITANGGTTMLLSYGFDDSDIGIIDSYHRAQGVFLLEVNTKKAPIAESL